MQNRQLNLTIFMAIICLFMLQSPAQADIDISDEPSLINGETMAEYQLRLDREDKANAIAERIRPVGRVRVRQVSMQQMADASVVADTAAAAVVSADAEAGQTAATAIDGATTYNSFCMACHLTGAGNAPKLTDKTAWAPRIAAAKDREGGFLKVVKEGKGLMPAQGTCMKCSDADLQAAIDYMLEQVK